MNSEKEKLDKKCEMGIRMQKEGHAENNWLKMASGTKMKLDCNKEKEQLRRKLRK